jgi:hypothetical protein
MAVDFRMVPNPLIGAASFVGCPPITPAGIPGERMLRGRKGLPVARDVRGPIQGAMARMLLDHDALSSAPAHGRHRPLIRHMETAPATLLTASRWRATHPLRNESDR